MRLLLALPGARPSPTPPPTSPPRCAERSRPTPAMTPAPPRHARRRRVDRGARRPRRRRPAPAPALRGRRGRRCCVRVLPFGLATPLRPPAPAPRRLPLRRRRRRRRGHRAWPASPPRWSPPTCSASTRPRPPSGCASRCSRTRPMALLNRLTILPPDERAGRGRGRPRRRAAGGPERARHGRAAPASPPALARARRGGARRRRHARRRARRRRRGQCDVPVDDALAERADRAAAALASLGAAASERAAERLASPRGKIRAWQPRAGTSASSPPRSASTATTAASR